jgi:two-component system CheB/CheR fusion protein
VHDKTISAKEALLRLFEQSVEHAIILIDSHGIVMACNPGAERIFAYQNGEMVGQPVSVLFTPEEVARGIAEHEMTTARSHGSAEDDRWMARSDGSRFWATGIMHALYGNGGEVIGFGKILRNRTDLMEQLETLRNQVRELQSAAHHKDVFLTTLSHELRNPLAAMHHATELIRRGDALSPEQQYPVDIIDRQIHALQRIVEDLMDVSRIGAGKVDLKKEPVSIHELVHRSLQTVGPLLRERRHAVDVLLPPMPIIVEVDAARMEQVFVNLLNNAAKYTPEKGHIWIKGTTEGRDAVVHIQDTGIGIQHDLLPRIFDLFTQADSSRSRAEGGLGVGLALVKNLVTLHGGSVQVRSNGEGKGSEFSVRLPYRWPGTSNPD